MAYFYAINSKTDILFIDIIDKVIIWHFIALLIYLK